MFADTDGISLNAMTATAVGTLLLAVAGALTFVFKLLFNLLIAAKDQQLADKDRQLTEWKERAASFQKLAERAVAAQESRATEHLEATGESGAPLLAKVPASHNSPVSDAQQFAADFESLKARQVAAELKMKIAPPVNGADAEAAKAEVIDKVKIVEIAPEAAAAIAKAAAAGTTAALQADKKADEP